MEIIGITVSVNYADILEQMIEQNSKFLYKWFIVTSEEDTKTRELILKSAKPNIEILFFGDFWKDGSRFNKGGALEYAQNHIEQNYGDANILILDSDIYLPDTFMESLPERIENEVLYGVSERLDFWTLDDFMKNRNPRRYSHDREFVGFFHLYKQNNYYRYKWSFNSSECDNDFRDRFRNRVMLNISVKHLGEEKVNWDGRVSTLYIL